METKNYLGLTEKGKWEEFGWDSKDEPTPENTGYEAVKPA